MQWTGPQARFFSLESRRGPASPLIGTTLTALADMQSEDDEATPQQIVDAWTAMGPSGDRARVMQAIAGIEEIVREMGRDLEYLQHPEQWDNPGDEYGEPMQFIQHHLATSNES